MVYLAVGGGTAEAEFALRASLHQDVVSGEVAPVVLYGLLNGVPQVCTV